MELANSHRQCQNMLSTIIKLWLFVVTYLIVYFIHFSVLGERRWEKIVFSTLVSNGEKLGS
jgi:hypothetical protein